MPVTKDELKGKKKMLEGAISEYKKRLNNKELTEEALGVFFEMVTEAYKDAQDVMAKAKAENLTGLSLTAMTELDIVIEGWKNAPQNKNPKTFKSPTTIIGKINDAARITWAPYIARKEVEGAPILKNLTPRFRDLINEEIEAIKEQNKAKKEQNKLPQEPKVTNTAYDDIVNALNAASSPEGNDEGIITFIAKSKLEDTKTAVKKAASSATIAASSVATAAKNMLFGNNNKKASPSEEEIASKKVAAEIAKKQAEAGRSRSDSSGPDSGMGSPPPPPPIRTQKQQSSISSPTNVQHVGGGDPEIMKKTIPLANAQAKAAAKAPPVPSRPHDPLVTGSKLATQKQQPLVPKVTETEFQRKAREMAKKRGGEDLERPNRPDSH